MKNLKAFVILVLTPVKKGWNGSRATGCINRAD